MIKKIFFVSLFILGLFNSLLFANDNMRIFQRENGEAITGFKTANLPEAIKINIAFPKSYKEQPSVRFPLVLLFDSREYSIEELNKMFYQEKSKNPQAIIAAFRLNNILLSQEDFDALIEEVLPFFELNYAVQNEPSQKVILAKDYLALRALNSMEKRGDYFFNLGLILNNTTSLPSFEDSLKKQSRIFCFSSENNILRLQNLFLAKGLKPMENFFFKKGENISFAQFDLRYFLNKTPQIKQIKTNLPKKITKETPFNLQVKTNYGLLDFYPTQIKFAPPILNYEESFGMLKILLPESQKVKISGIFAGKKWSSKVKVESEIKNVDNL